MLQHNNLAKYFWAEAVNTACYISNRVLIRPLLNKTPYELFYDRTPRIDYFKVFGCKCFILNTKDSLDKFDAKSVEGIFLGYSSHSKAYKVFNKSSNTIEESMHVSFCESIDQSVLKQTNDDDVESTDLFLDNTTKSNEDDHQRTFVEIRDHPQKQILGDLTKGVQTRAQLERIANMAFISQLEPKKIDEAIIDEFWMLAMTEELNQFQRNDVWDLVPRTKGSSDHWDKMDLQKQAR